jgi:hypothetical protein
MKTCGFTTQSDKVDADLPGLQENWAEVKRSILQSEGAVMTAVAQQIQGAQQVITEAVGAGLTATSSQNNQTHMILRQILKVLQPGCAAANAPANNAMPNVTAPEMQPIWRGMHGQKEDQGNQRLQMPLHNHLPLPMSSMHGSPNMSPTTTALHAENVCNDVHMGDEQEDVGIFFTDMGDQEEQAYSLLSNVSNMRDEQNFYTADRMDGRRFTLRQPRPP